MRWFFYVSMVLAVLSGCGGQVKPDDDGATAIDRSGTSDTGRRGGAQVGAIDGGDRQSATTIVDGIQQEVSYEKEALHDAANVLSNRTIYFDFDSSTLSADDQEIIKHHGKYLALNSSASVRLEGHTDERGSREYNVALADRRAQAVKRLLLFQGASRDQIIVISYGEEKPAALGHDESAWALNRRAEMVYGE